MAATRRLAVIYRWLYPELERFESRDEQVEMMAACRGWIPWWIGATAGILGGLALRGTLRRLLGTWFGIGGFWLESTQALISVLVVSLCLAGWVHWRTQGVRRRLRRRLVEKGVPICVDCGYDLSAQETPRCPECGRTFDPALLEPNGARRETEAGREKRGQSNEGE